MAKTELQKHLEDLADETSGGAHDAVTFSGRGLDFLKGLFKSKKRNEDEDEEDMDDEDDENEDDDDEPRSRKRRVKKSRGKNSKEVDDETLEEEDDEDLDDPGDDEDDEDIITNKGKRVKGKAAMGKSRGFDTRRFEKSMAEHEDVIDAEPVLRDLTKHVRTLGKSTNATQAKLDQVLEQNIILGRAVRELLKSNAALASDLEEVKKQPVGSPDPGYVVMTKSEKGGSKRRLRKSDISDAITEAMNDGLEDGSRLLKRLSSLDVSELQEFVEALPAEVQQLL